MTNLTKYYPRTPLQKLNKNKLWYHFSQQCRPLIEGKSSNLGQHDVFELFWINLRWNAYTRNIYEAQTQGRKNSNKQFKATKGNKKDLLNEINLLF